MFYVLTVTGNKIPKVQGEFNSMEEATKYAKTLNQYEQNIFIAKVNTSNNNQN